MKFEIIINDNGIKSTSSKVISPKSLKLEIKRLELVFGSYLKKNPHTKNVKSVTMNLTLCGKSKIRSMNLNYRKIDKVTDVLSFPIFDNIREDSKPSEILPPVIDLGDIVICKEKIISQAIEYNISNTDELIHLAVHGFLHLLGYDHEVSANEQKIMERNEALLLRRISLNKKAGKV